MSQSQTLFHKVDLRALEQEDGQIQLLLTGHESYDVVAVNDGCLKILLRRSLSDQAIITFVAPP